MLETRRPLIGGDLRRGRRGVGGKIDGCSGNDGVRKHPRIGIHWFDTGGGEDALDELPTNGKLLFARGRRVGDVGGGCELRCALGRKREFRCCLCCMAQAKICFGQLKATYSGGAIDSKLEKSEHSAQN